LLDHLGEGFDRHFLVAANVNDLSYCQTAIDQAKDCLDAVLNIAETPRLLPRSKNSDGGPVQRLRHEIRQDHSVPACLPGAYGVEETRDDDGQFFFFPIGKSQKFIERF
jgi:hypothetical protein